MELPGEVTCVLYNPLTLSPDAVGVQVQLMDTLLSGACDFRGMPFRRGAVSRSVGLGFGDDLTGGVVSLLKDSGDFPADALQRALRTAALGLDSWACMSWIWRCNCATYASTSSRS